MGLIEQYRKLHRSDTAFEGFSSLKHKKQIAAVIRDTGSKTVLDYGCGKGRQYTQIGINKGWDCSLTLYDPAVDLFSGKPEGTFDGVICIDVLEHLEERDIPSVLDEIFEYAEKFVFLGICTRESKKKLPDGRNCHLTVRPKEWWLEVIGNGRDIVTAVAWNE